MGSEFRFKQSFQHQANLSLILMKLAKKLFYALNFPVEHELRLWLKMLLANQVLRSVITSTGRINGFDFKYTDRFLKK